MGREWFGATAPRSAMADDDDTARLRLQGYILDIRGPPNFSSFGPGPSGDQL